MAAGRVRVLAALSQEHAGLPEAEFGAVLAADGIPWQREGRYGKVLVGVAQGKRPALLAAVARLAMTFEVDEHRFTVRPIPELLETAARTHPLPRAGSFAVRGERTEADAPSPNGPRRADVERVLGKAWYEAGPVDLDNPERVIRAWLHKDSVLVGNVLWENDRGAYEERTASARPFFSPVTGHPRIMRAVTNLAGVPRGGVVYDPLCGTGGILIEAALAGYLAVGSDVDPAMVDGSGRNLAHFGARAAALFAADVREAPARFRKETGLAAPDGIVTDLPYGQSASTLKQGPKEIAKWTLSTIAAMLPAGRRAVLGTADPSHLEPLPTGLEREASYALRVHKTLTRTYVVLRRAT